MPKYKNTPENLPNPNVRIVIKRVTWEKVGLNIKILLRTSLTLMLG